MEIRDSAPAKEIIIQRVYRNEELAAWIECEFSDPHERVVAWQVAFQIGKMFPEVNEKIRGELIDEDIQEA